MVVGDRDRVRGQGLNGRRAEGSAVYTPCGGYLPSLLADVGNPLEFDKDASGKVIKGHLGEMLWYPFSGVAMCYKHGIPLEAMHIVATHSHEGEKVQRSMDSIIFHHADFVDFDIAKYFGR